MLPLFRPFAPNANAAPSPVEARDPGQPSRALLKLLKQRVVPLPGTTAEEVLASDLRLRRRLGSESGRQSGFATGGLGGSAAKLTLPSLVGI